METSVKNDKRQANHIRIYAFASMSSGLYFGMMNFKRNGLPYSAITIVALVSYAAVVPLAHVTHLQTIHARSSNTRVVQLVTFEWLTEFLTAILTLLFLGPAVYGAYAFSSCYSMGSVSLLTVNWAALVMALAMLFTPTRFIKGSFNRSISLAFTLPSLGMLVNTYFLTQIPTERAWWESVQGFAERILATVLSLLITFFSIAIAGIAGAYESRPVRV